ncbi:MAG: hypothetical protein GWN32_15845 [Gemmatimonadetes bacterium]|nr:hypothetical protein [Gemmatimonadota bacterium]
MSRSAAEQEGRRTGAVEPLASDVRLKISGIRCASEAVPLERALERLEGASAATVNPLLEYVWLRVESLAQLEGAVRLLVRRGYSVDPNDVAVTVRLPGAPANLEQLRRQLSSLRCVAQCRVARRAGRLELELALGDEWETALDEMRFLAGRIRIGSEP